MRSADQKEPVEVIQPSDQHILGKVLGEDTCLVLSHKSWKNCQRDRGLRMSALTAPATQTWVNGREWMDGWIR